MTAFDDLMEQAKKFRSEEDILAEMPEIKSSAEVAIIPDDRILAEMAAGVFRAGFSWKVIKQKWPGFEEVFEGFNPERLKFMSDDDLDRYLSDKRIVRHAKKIMSVRDNAILLCDLAEEHGSAAKCIANWPMDDFGGLLEMLKKRGNRLGGMTGQYVLRGLGQDGWALGRDVVTALIREGVIDKNPTAKRDIAKVQAYFNAVSAESGKPFAHISRLLALSVGPAFFDELP